MERNFSMLCAGLEDLKIISEFSSFYHHRYDETTHINTYTYYDVNDPYLLNCLKRVHEERKNVILKSSSGYLKVEERYEVSGVWPNEAAIIINLDYTKIKLDLFYRIAQFYNLESHDKSISFLENILNVSEACDFVNEYKIEGDLIFELKEGSSKKEYKLISLIDKILVDALCVEVRNYNPTLRCDLRDFILFEFMNKQ